MKAFDAEAAGATTRSQVYWLLSGLLLDQPTAASLRELHAALASAGDDPPAIRILRQAAAEALTSADALVELQVDHAKLLRGIDRSRGLLEPYESLAREGRLFGAATEAVAAAYREAGFDAIAPDAGPCDHAGTELRFVSLLGFEELKAWQAGDAAAAALWRARQLRFLDEHVARWIPAHLEHLRDAASTPFYRAAATLVADVCSDA